MSAAREEVRAGLLRLVEAETVNARNATQLARDVARRAQRAYERATELWTECPVPSQSGCRCERCREGGAA